MLGIYPKNKAMMMVFRMKNVMGILPCKKSWRLYRMEKETKTPNMAKKYASIPDLAQRFEFLICISNNVDIN